MKKFLIGLAVVITLIIVIALLLPGSVTVKRSIDISAPAENAFDQVNTLKNWEEWSPWKDDDPNMEMTYTGPPSGAGAIYTWKGNNKVGSGTMTITKSLPHQHIDFTLSAEGMGTSTGTWEFEKTESGTTVTWTFVGDMTEPFLIGKFFGLAMESMLGPYLETGLARIKERAEAAPVAAPLEVLKISLDEAQWALTIRDTIEMGEMAGMNNKAFDTILEFMEANGIEKDAAPFTVYHSENSEAMVIEAGIPVTDSVAGFGNIQLRKIEGGNFVTATHIGAYEKLPATYASIREWIESHQIEPAGPPREVYITNPMDELSEANWFTQIFYRVE